jgi:hypothetical protein
MEFYSAMKKNEIFSFLSKWMELKNITFNKLAKLRKPKNCMFSSYVDFRSRAKAVMLLDLGHTPKRAHIWEE